MTNEKAITRTTIAGKDLVLTPTFEAQSDIESRTGLAMMTLLRQSANQTILTTHIAAILWAAAGAGMDKKAPSYREVGTLLAEEGLSPAVFEAVGSVLSTAVAGTRTAVEISGTEVLP